MTVALGVMQLPAGQDSDSNRRYLNGSLPDGGLWTALTRVSNHDHTGGLNGTPISVSSIPDGSITTAKLDPSVLLPYALTDGSKPFTGQVTMQADAVVRDAVAFGQQGSANPPDATLTRTGAAQVALNPGTAKPSAGGVVGMQYGPRGFYHAGSNYASVAYNAYFDGASWRLAGADAASRLMLVGPSMSLEHSGAGAADAAFSWVPRLAVGATGTVTLTPDAGQPAVATAGALGLAAGGATRASWATTGTLTLTPDAGQPALVTPGAFVLQSGGGGHLVVQPNSGYLVPLTDNAYACGHAGLRWQTIYAVNGTIQTSAVASKQDITPLDPAACAQAVLDTDWVAFEYTAPPLPPGPPGEKVAQSTARVSAHARMVQETAPARKQRGYVLGSAQHRVSDLFGLEDRRSASPQADLAVVAAALQNVLHRLEALEAPGTREGA